MRAKAALKKYKTLRSSQLWRNKSLQFLSGEYSSFNDSNSGSPMANSPTSLQNVATSFTTETSKDNLQDLAETPRLIESSEWGGSMP